jgi:hypothetical protein
MHNDFGAFLLAINGINLNWRIFLNVFKDIFGWGVVKLEEDFYESKRLLIK